MIEKLQKQLYSLIIIVGVILYSLPLLAATRSVFHEDASIGFQILSSTSFYLVLLILILLIVYFICQSLWRKTIILLSITGTIAFGISNIIEQLDFITFHEQIGRAHV